MTTPNGVFSLKAIANGSNTNLVVVGQAPQMPGSLVILDGTTQEASLSFVNVDGEKYGWVVGDAGHVSGVAIGVGAEKNYKDSSFIITDGGSIYHQLTAATNMWLACDRTVNGEQHKILAWGNQGSDGRFPDGCSFASVKQSCADDMAPTDSA
ncbi:uncharacterized protein RCC_02736 [Ramularia collo-cygni]|uniref:DUF7907 domain-containing protein n=1 Tax=Ramularia collo-cygni TaxID=112498 RepID=A0A2D3UP12_9PEZI|nr:uncharacterized protein RCC_02736 [Ramularia collo-cygni]CZT16901.1 uncharacterized protein RCC_02736 [Ramularia collo-cygni]